MDDTGFSTRIGQGLSEGAWALWGKVSSEGMDWLPLAMHMHDSSEITRLLWNRWVPDATKRRICTGVNGGEGLATARAEDFATFVSAAHDIGKCTPAFQWRRIPNNPDMEAELRRNLAANGLTAYCDREDFGTVHHALASELIAERHGIDRSIAVILGGHHGRPPSRGDLKKRIVDSHPHDTGFCDEMWLKVQDEILEYAAALGGLDIAFIKTVSLDIEAQVLLTGIVIMSDWIASNESYFPYLGISVGGRPPLDGRSADAWARFDAPRVWHVDRDLRSDVLYESRFGFAPHPFQRAVAEIADSVGSPGIMVIEAPMGEGKTEAALAASEIIAGRFGYSGAMFTLPTQATADGVFTRISDWVRSACGTDPREMHSMFLAHGRSRYNTQYASLRHASREENGDQVYIHTWLDGRKKGLLSDFVVGTVDQVLMCGLKQRHLAMRHLGVANKVVVIDECHAYDAYMGSYLCRTLQWLGAYGVPVIILSATLPPSRRRSLVDSYLDARRIPAERGKECSEWALDASYPLITYTDGDRIVQRTSESSGRGMTVRIERVDDSGLLPFLDGMTADGGYVGIVVNTVGRSQAMADRLSDRYGGDRVHLVHSGYTHIDRTARESEIMGLLRRRTPADGPVFIVGTQVLEQSLDIDFDLLVTDLCPVDLLLQRIGRLHRHSNGRPRKLESPVCAIIDSGDGSFESGSEFVYGRYALMNTRILVPDSVRIPDDIAPLVYRAYSADVDVPEGFREAYAAARKDHESAMTDKEYRATTFQIPAPWEKRDLVGWMDGSEYDPSGKRAEATVRDIDGSLEVILVQRRADGTFHVLPWVDGIGGSEIPRDRAPTADQAFAISGCKVQLPKVFTHRKALNDTLKEIERINKTGIPQAWQNSEWLSGELFLQLDENNMLPLINKIMQYDFDHGLRIIENRP